MRKPIVQIVPRQSHKLRIIVFQDGDSLCAQWVDFDLAAQAPTLPLLYETMDKMIRGHIAVREKHRLPPFKDLPPAPEKFREMFDRSKMKLPPQFIKGRRKLPPAEVRIAAA
jgi:hypothetical protein